MKTLKLGQYLHTDLLCFYQSSLKILLFGPFFVPIADYHLELIYAKLTAKHFTELGAMLDQAIVFCINSHVIREINAVFGVPTSP